MAASSLLGLLWLLSTPLVGYLALASLERWYPPLARAPQPHDTIVVLSGSQLADRDGTRFYPGPDSVSRCVQAAQLYHQAGGCRLVVCGGRVDTPISSPSLAQTMGELLQHLGVDREKMLLEEQSSTTYENARFGKDMLGNGAHEVFLVTDAASMWRAEACFRAQGISIIPAPSAFRTAETPDLLLGLLPSGHGIDGVNDAAHEWVGLAWYWARGYLQHQEIATNSSPADSPGE